MQLMHLYPYVLLFMLNFTEGSIVTLLAGLSAPITHMNIPVAVAVLIVADVFSDILYYSLGRFSTRVFSGKTLRIFGITHTRLEMMRSYYDKHGKVTLFFAKMSDVLAMPAILLAGFSTMEFKSFILISGVTSVFKATAIFTAGYLLSGGQGEDNAQLMISVLSGLSILILVLVIFRYYYLKIKRDKFLYAC